MFPVPLAPRSPHGTNGISFSQFSYQKFYISVLNTKIHKHSDKFFELFFVRSEIICIFAKTFSQQSKDEHDRLFHTKQQKTDARRHTVIRKRKMKRTDTLSKAISLMQIPAVAIIILLHSYTTARGEISETNSTIYYYISYLLSMEIGNMGVPLYFTISGILFLTITSTYTHIKQK